MRAIQDRRNLKVEREKKLLLQKDNVSKQTSLIRLKAAGVDALEKSRNYYAASKIEAMVRGFLARRFFSELLRQVHAAIIIQKLVRGRLGRLKWMRKYWEKTSVVKSKYALQQILNRSKVIREEDSIYRGYPIKGPWKELYDPLTDSFWYYNTRTGRNTWECPLSLQKEFICCWDGYHSFGGYKSQGRCRKIFQTAIEYQGHLRRDHAWHCPACGFRNAGLVFPTCNLCDNDKSVDGEDGELVLKQKYEHVQTLINNFLKSDFKAACAADYNLRNRVSELALANREKGLLTDHLSPSNSPSAHKRRNNGANVMDGTNDGNNTLVTEESSITLGLSEWQSQSQMSLFKPSSSSSLNNPPSLHSHSHSHSYKSHAHSHSHSYKSHAHSHSHSYKSHAHSHSQSLSEPASSNTGVTTLLRADELMSTTHSANNNYSSSGAFLPSIDLKTTPQQNTKTLGGVQMVLYPTDHYSTDAIDSNQRNDRKRALNDDSSSTAKLNLRLNGNPAPVPPHSPDFGQFLESKLKATQAKHKDTVVEVSEWTRLQISKGFITPADFDYIMGDNMQLTEEEDEDISVTEEDEVKAAQASIPQNLWLHETNTISDKQQVCRRFMKKACTLTTCPLAHPGVRDAAAVTYGRMPGKVHKIPFVTICKNWPGNCPHGANCDYYHCYIRPSTEEIISKLYPKEDGTRSKNYYSGAYMRGNVKEGHFTGYGVFQWRNGATYLGDWEMDRRHGLGIYRTAEGAEYIGEWSKGVRHGWGILYHPNGEEYVGQWENGKMHGVGRLSSKNGDVYEGEFREHRYEGIGSFLRRNGDRYLGFVRDGYAHGLGIQVLCKGEKYKGYFDRDVRHGKGACAYSNGSRYAGEWYRGQPCGFGVYISPIGERYVGQWDGGTKSGLGRYLYENGDFYDGKWVKDKAEGMGVYHHTKEGNIYTGEWHDSKRNGRGTYVFGNGSKFTGTWRDNNIDGKGKFDYANGSYYRGNFLKNKKHGKGVFTWNNGNEYKGDFENDNLHGFGEMKYTSGHKYIGNWQNNMKNGSGTFSYLSGHLYEGEWKDDVRHGKGTMIFYVNTIIQETYCGDWFADERHGQGKYTYKVEDGTIYEGEWVRNVRHGQGKLTLKDGSYYRGTFVRDQLQGHAIYVGADGTQYEGGFVDNQRDGIGSLLDTDGSIYTGEFSEGLRHGNGRIQYIDGGVYQGIWNCGVIVGQGKFTIDCGSSTRGGPTQLVMKVFGF